MAVTAGRLVTVLEAQTAQFDARMTAAATAVERFARPQVVAARAAGQLRTGIQQLTLQAFHATGPIGNLGAGILGIFGGPAALAIAGTAAAIALAVRAMGREASEAEKRLEGLHRQWLQLMQSRGAGVGIRGQLTGTGGDPGLLEQRTALMAEQQTLAAMRANPALFAGPGGSTVDLLRRVDKRSVEVANELAKLSPVISVLTTDLDKWSRDLRESDAMKRLDDAVDQVATAVNEFFKGVDLSKIPGFQGQLLPGLEGQGIIPTPPGSVAAGAARQADFNSVVERIQAVQAAELERAKILSVLGNAEQMATLDTMGLGHAATVLAMQMSEAADKVEQKAIQMQVAIVNAIAGAIAAIVSGGGPGGILMGLGGIVGLVNPLAGAIVAGVGGVISAAESRRSREDRENTDRIVTAIEDPENNAIVLVRDDGFGGVAQEDQLARTLERMTDRRVLVRSLRDGRLDMRRMAD